MATASRITAVVVAGTIVLAGSGHAATPAIEQGKPVKPLAQVTEELLRAGVPPVLSQEDAKRYRRIFTLQDQGDWATAESEIARLRNRVLLGHVRYQKLMHPTEYRSSFADLAGWLESYADHPGARLIHRLALRRQGPDDDRPPTPGSIKRLGGYGPDWPSHALKIGDTRSQRRFAQDIIRLVTRGQYDRALARLHGGPNNLSPEDVAQLEGRIAIGYYADGDYWRAFTLAAAASTSVEPGFSWIHLRAGLAALQLDLTYSALEHFGQAAITPGSTWETASGAYWAARIHARIGHDGDAEDMLRTAAKFPLTLYGQLALEELGLPERNSWIDRQAVTVNSESPMLTLPAAQRAVALVQAGRIYEADSEFRLLAGEDRGTADTELLAFAMALDLPGVQIRLGSRLERSGSRNLSALYPASDWLGSASTEVDQALVHAIVHKESGFHIRAKSSRGARGLMQVLPRIGRKLTGDNRLRGPGADYLYDPVFNLRLGQRVLGDILKHPDIGRDLIGALVAYNAGARHWVAWKERIDADHPLLFIESIPLLETRWFVKRVLASLWMYRDRFRQHKPARTALSHGKWPQYVPLDSGAGKDDTELYVGS